MLGAGAPVWLLDPRDAQYLDASVEELRGAMGALLGEGLLRLAADDGFATPTAKLMERREGYEVGGKRVRRLLREDNLLAIRRRKFVATTDSGHGSKVYPNLAQYLELTQVNQLWVADLTYVRWVRSSGFWRGCWMALRMAIQSRHPLPGLVHHSDQGSQYASADYVQCLEAVPAVLSMSRAGRPWENGRCESFIKTLKQEEIDARSYGSLEELAQHLEEFMEQIYNRQRLHSALGYRSPAEFEQQQADAASASGWRPAALVLPRYQECGTGEAAR